MEPVIKNTKWKAGWIVGFICAGLLAFKLISIITGPMPKRPNLLLIKLDTLRPDHLNVYGYHRATSPSLSKLAEDSFVFENAYTVATNSGPSHATLLTGLYPAQHGLMDNGQRILAEVPTLAETLHQTGYDTAGFVGYFALGEESGLAKGFEKFEYHPIASHDHDDKKPEDDLKGFEAVTGWLKSWIQKPVESRSPFFLWMHVQNIHESYDPAPPYNSMFGKAPDIQTLAGFEGEFDMRCANDLAKAWRAGILPPHFKQKVVDLYDGEIRLVDDQLGRIFDTLKSMKAYDDTIIVIVSDHGEILFELYENDFYKKGPGHSARYSDTSIQVPLILKPAVLHQLEKTRNIAQMVSTIDMVPTLLELLGLRIPEYLSGESWVSTMRREGSEATHKKIFFHEKPDGSEYIGVRTDQWKFVTKKEEGLESSLLIDLVNDPEENQSSDSLEKVNEMTALLGEWRKKSPSISTRRKMTEAMRQALKEGGYLRK